MKRVKELKETIEQLKRSVDSLNGRINPAELSHFAQGYNQAIRFAMAITMMDIQVIETKIKLIEDEKI